TGELSGGCCGLAGNFGFEKGHFEVSRACAHEQLLPAVRDAPADAVVLADGFSCRTQLEQLAGTGARHLAEVLAEALAEGPAGDPAEGPAGDPAEGAAGGSAGGPAGGPAAGPPERPREGRREGVTGGGGEGEGGGER
ncbi:FAD-binding oxidoreductase, partial [Streptomyces asoensis]